MFWVALVVNALAVGAISYGATESIRWLHLLGACVSGAVVAWSWKTIERD